MKVTTANLAVDQVVSAGYARSTREFMDENQFKGFRWNELSFGSLKALKTHLGVSNLKDLEAEADRLDLGTVTAEFYALDGAYQWGSYLWNGAFRVGTSADRLRLAAGA
jgi:hypothetical protein